MGASPAWTFATVTLPLAAPGVIAGMILSFAKAMGEFGATITFVSNIPGQTQTLPTADLHLHPSARRRPDGTAAVGARGGRVAGRPGGERVGRLRRRRARVGGG